MLEVKTVDSGLMFRFDAVTICDRLLIVDIAVCDVKEPNVIRRTLGWRINQERTP